MTSGCCVMVEDNKQKKLEINKKAKNCPDLSFLGNGYKIASGGYLMRFF
jgi:hypothetical protein